MPSAQHSLSIIAVVLALVSVVILSLTINYERWPVHEVTKQQQSIADLEATKYKKLNRHARQIQQYDHNGDYLDWGATTRYVASDRMIFDSNGLPMVKYGQTFEYNPVTIAQYFLTAHGQRVNGGTTMSLDSAMAKLLEMQGADGAFRYNFPWKHYTMDKPYEPGWISGMAQGNALSAIARAYTESPSPTLLQAGNKAVAFLMIPASGGGPRTDLRHLDPSLKNYVFFMEYVTDPPVYTLNGFMFTLLGLYDWWQATGSTDAEDLFKEGIKTLEKILPYYDFGGMSCYDLSYFTVQRDTYKKKGLPHMAARYHAVHITQLRALYSVTHNSVLLRYATLWARRVEVS